MIDSIYTHSFLISHQLYVHYHIPSFSRSSLFCVHGLKSYIMGTVKTCPALRTENGSDDAMHDRRSFFILLHALFMISYYELYIYDYVSPIGNEVIWNRCIFTEFYTTHDQFFIQLLRGG